MVFLFSLLFPNTKTLEGVIELNKNGEIIADPDRKVNITGIFAAGDCIAKKYRQVTTAVADGTIAALSAAEYINNEFSYN